MKLTKALVSVMTIVALAGPAAGLMTSCSSSKQAASVVTRRQNNGSKKEPSLKPPRLEADAPDSWRSLYSEGCKWLGTPYKYGGNDRNGVDCSGLMVAIYRDALNIKLPRTSRQQSEWCRRVDIKNLQPGDLLFFDTSRDRNGKVSHVGLYLGSGEMLHSSTSRGVIVSAIVDNYYSERLLACGRVAEMGSDRPGKADRSDRSDKANKANRPDSDPRAAVLSSLIEEKLDSIFVNADH
jgi:hypothetical protein